MTVDHIVKTSDLFGQISQSIRYAADQVGVNFDYLFQQAKIESGLNPDARARTSSATGLFQFTRGTWLQVVAQHGEVAGLSQESNALRSGIATAADRQRILDLRTNPDLSARLAAHHALDNARALSAQGIKQSGPTELYLAHFLGSNGAAKFLNAMKSNPHAPAASLLPEAAQSNKTIFFRDGTPTSLNDIYQRFNRKFDGAAAPSPTTLALAKSAIKADIAKNNGLAGDMLIAQLKAQDTLLARQSPLKTLPKLPKDALSGAGKEVANGLADEMAGETGFGQHIQSSDQATASIYQPRRASRGEMKPQASDAYTGYQMPIFEGDAPVSVDSLAKFLDAASKWSPDPGALQKQAQHGLTARNAFEGLRT